jgi:hypothetical protein
MIEKIQQNAVDSLKEIKDNNWKQLDRFDRILDIYERSIKDSTNNFFIYFACKQSKINPVSYKVKNKQHLGLFLYLGNNKNKDHC